jgi:hypothetical protein
MMGKQRNDGGGRASIPRLLRMAFRHAEEGVESKVWEFWRSAIARGYDVRPHTLDQLKGIMAQVRRDRGLPLQDQRLIQIEAPCLLL